MGKSIEMPRYIKIAIDVALRIHKGKFEEGEKLRGRSVLAGEYNVSPETIRKAMKLLDDTGVVLVLKGSGVIVKSKEKACEFLVSFKDKETIGSIRCDMKKLLKEKKDIERKLNNLNEKIIDYSYRFRHHNEFEPVQVDVQEGSSLIGKSVGEIKFWHNTGGTILGVKRESEFFISPGPYWELREADILFVVGDEGILDRVRKFIE